MSERAQALEAALRRLAQATRDTLTSHKAELGCCTVTTARLFEAEQLLEQLALAAPPVGVSPQPDLHAAIMNIPCRVPSDVVRCDALVGTGVVVIAYERGHRDARHAAAELALSPPDAQVCVWREIETAPKDGTEVLLLGPDGSIDFGHWRADRKYAAGGVWRMRQWLYVFPDAVAWSPIPPRWAPAPQGGEQ